MGVHSISDAQLTLKHIQQILDGNKQLSLSEKSIEKIEKCYRYLHKKLASSETPIYGINTGFGALCDTRIEKDDLSLLQENLVKSHACGMGEEVPSEIVKIMLLLKIQGLSFGHSGVSLKTIHRLIEFYNHAVLPVVFQQGSLGASGDLAPLAHLSLPLIGKGEVYYQGRKRNAQDVLRELNLEPLKLEAKEGLALLNGTQFMSAYGTWCMLKMMRLSAISDMIGALSLEAFDGRTEPFHPLIHSIRNQYGQALTAANFQVLFEGSEISKQVKKQVQDPYSFRCIPQVHGASKNSLKAIASIIETEINSVTDNPTIFPDEDLIISAGNFHGQPLALAFDQLAIAVAELGSISERRVYKLISGQRGLPAFLVANPGLNSGFMIPQYTAASIVSQNKQLCSPSSVDTIDSSNGQEDHVSMGANGATRCYRVVENLEKILSIEYLNASQAIEFRRPLKTSPVLEGLLKTIRAKVAFVKNDIYMHEAMQLSGHALHEIEIPAVVASW